MTRYEAMEEYQRDVKPYLQDIEHHAAMAVLSVRKIKFRPSFVTAGHAEMLALERTLVDALATVRAAQEEYGAKEIEHAA